jgi:AAA family ATP:ADP antiporter
MLSQVRSWLGSLFEVDEQDRLKVIFLSVTYLLVIGAYTVAKELKDSIFISAVGKEYLPWAKISSMIVLVPAVLLYSKLVDVLRRYQLLSVCCTFFGLVSLIIAYQLGDPLVGLSNTHTSPDRIYGWLVYYFVEGYTPFVVSVVWAFANSITSPEGAKKNYALMVAGSKIGGMLTSGIAWAIFSMGATSSFTMSDVARHQLVFAGSALMLLCVPGVIWLMMRMVPGRYMHGYEAAYQVEKSKAKTNDGIFSGLILLFKYPYVLGIFSMIFFYEVVATVLSYLRVGVAQSTATSISDVSGFFFKIIFMMHAASFVIAFFGTRTLLKKLGERICLVLIPLLTGVLLLYLMVVATPGAVVVAFVALKSINFAFSWPVRESLYIPTVKDIKFKSRSWIDAFGGKFAKSSGSTFNIIATKFGESAILSLHSVFFAIIIGFWFVAALLLGKRFETAVANNEVIGFDKAEDGKQQAA